MLDAFSSQFTYFAYLLYFLAMFLEYGISYFKKENLYGFKDSLVNMGTGLFAFFLPYMTHVLIVTGLYSLLHPVAVLEAPRVWFGILSGQSFHYWFLLLLFLSDDFCYYMYHRVSHICRFLWCVHEVHHSSEKFNFTVYFRSSFLEYVFQGFFFIPVILFGFQLEDILLEMSFNLFYQFWIHTSYTKRIYGLDLIFNTPSHHRVHHARNIPYLDRNFGGILCIWDRLLGTFVPETEKPVFGILTPINSFNPFVVNLKSFRSLWDDMKSAPNWGDKFRYFFSHPGWKADGTGKTSRQLQEDYHTENKVWS